MMSGPCLCGDVYCPNCGEPGQAEKEQVADWVFEVLLADIHPSVSVEWWTEELMTRLGKEEELRVALEVVSSRWSRSQEEKRDFLYPRKPERVQTRIFRDVYGDHEKYMKEEKE